MAFTVISAARLPLLPPSRARPLTTLQASRHAADRPVAPPYRAFDAGHRPRPFPDDTASLLPGLLAATRTGLTPASDDELRTRRTPWHYVTVSPPALLGARKIRARASGRIAGFVVVLTHVDCLRRGMGGRSRSTFQIVAPVALHDCNLAFDTALAQVNKLFLAIAGQIFNWCEPFPA